MSLMVPMKEDFWILSVTTQRILLARSLFPQMQNTKVIIIDEADNTTPDVQLLLRASIEEFSGNCRFIFTCNYKNKIIEPLHSRCAVVEFSVKCKTKTPTPIRVLQ